MKIRKFYEMSINSLMELFNSYKDFSKRVYDVSKGNNI